MSNFHSIKIAAIENTTDDCVLITLNIPATLKETFAYKHGQYLTFKASINDEEVRRSYSLCSSPLDDKWQVGIKKIPDGRFSTYANTQLKVGDTLEVMAPQGHFTLTSDSKQSRNYLMIAAGSGITPIHSIIKTQLASEPDSSVTLFYINQSSSTIILKESLEALKNQYLGRLRIFHFLTREKRSAELFNGRINGDKLETLFNTVCDVDKLDNYFLCGPESMIHLVKDFLIGKGVSSDKIHFELFGTPASTSNERKQEIEKQFTGKTCELTIQEGGRTLDITVPQGQGNVLDAALDNNADLPFACKGGVCATCKAKIVEGSVEMLLSYGLEQDEIDDGYILTCQAVPTSERCVVDFDI